MPARAERHTGLHRGQTMTSTSYQSAGTSETDYLRTSTPTPSRRSMGTALTNGSRLKSGIKITYPDKSPQEDFEWPKHNPHFQPRRKDITPPGLDHRTPPQRPGINARSERSSGAHLGIHSEGSNQRRRGSRSGSRITHEKEAKLMEELRHLKVEKGMAEEQARQAEKQAQDLMEERARIKAEKERLERDNVELTAQVEIYQGMMSENGMDEEDLPLQALDADHADDLESVSLYDTSDQEVISDAALSHLTEESFKAKLEGAV